MLNNKKVRLTISLLCLVTSVYFLWRGIVLLDEYIRFLIFASQYPVVYESKAGVPGIIHLVAGLMLMNFAIFVYNPQARSRLFYAVWLSFMIAWPIAWIIMSPTAWFLLLIDQGYYVVLPIISLEALFMLLLILFKYRKRSRLFYAVWLSFMIAWPIAWTALPIAWTISPRAWFLLLIDQGYYFFLPIILLEVLLILMLFEYRKRTKKHDVNLGRVY